MDGNIGYHATGHCPIRAGYDGSVPVDGSSGQYEWTGFIPFEELPAFFNPPQGYIVTANQNPFPKDYKYPVHGAFAPQYRSNQIRSSVGGAQRAEAGRHAGGGEGRLLGVLRILARKIVAAYDHKKPADAALADAVAVLRPWNGQMEKGTAAPMLITLAYYEFRKRVAEAASPGKGDVYGVEMAPVGGATDPRKEQPGLVRGPGRGAA